jgi:hypothetical protein
LQNGERSKENGRGPLKTPGQTRGFQQQLVGGGRRVYRTRGRLLKEGGIIFHPYLFVRDFFANELKVSSLVDGIERAHLLGVDSWESQLG